MTRIGPVERNAEAQSEIALEKSGVEADEMGAVFIRDTGLDPLQEAGALEDFQTERTRRVVVGREQGEASESVPRDDAGEQVEVVLDHARMNRLRGDIDHPRARLGEEEEEKKKALFVGLNAEAGDRRVDRHRGDDDDGLFILVEGLDRAPERHELFLERVKLVAGLRRRNALGQSNKTGIDLHFWKLKLRGKPSRGGHGGEASVTQSRPPPANLATGYGKVTTTSFEQSLESVSHTL